MKIYSINRKPAFTKTDVDGNPIPDFVKQYHTDSNGRTHDLESSISFHNRLFPTSGSPVDLSADFIIKEVGFNGKSTKFKNAAIRNIVANVFFSELHCQVVAVSRNSSDYSGHRSLSTDHYTYKIMISALDKLIDTGYIEQKNGFTSISGESKRTRIWATLKLLELIESQNPIELDKPIAHSTEINGKSFRIQVENWKVLSLEESDLIQCKLKARSGSKKSLRKRVPASKGVHRMTSQMLEYNSFMKNVYILIGAEQYQEFYSRNEAEQRIAANSGITRDYLLVNPPFGRYLFNGIYGHRSAYPSIGNTRSSIYTITNNDSNHDRVFIRLNSDLYRVFGESFDDGGRLYGARYQQLPNNDQWPMRSSLLINGNPVVEVDYSGFHVRMLYHMKGIECYDDPYDIGIDKQFRPIVKVMTNVMLNGRKQNGVVYATLNSINKDEELGGAYYERTYRPSLKSIHELLIEKHKAVSEYFHSGIGIKLQKKDSDIAVEILMHFTRAGIPCLCVHDSFIVEKQHEQLLIDTMKDVYREKFHFDCPVKVK